MVKKWKGGGKREKVGGGGQNSGVRPRNNDNSNDKKGAKNKDQKASYKELMIMIRPRVTSVVLVISPCD